MRKSVGACSDHPAFKRQRALLAAALVTLTPLTSVLSAQADLATLRARAAEGQPEAQNALANAYVGDPAGVQNLGEALRLYQLAADKGLAAAQFNLGMMHELGRGVGRDPAVAFKHYLRAAEQGFGPAQFNVGNMYANGTGVKQDYFEASLWFRQAADRGIPEAQYNLALAHELGRGVPKDESAAHRWYRAAARQGYSRAQYNLALMLEEGRGSPPDAAAAIELYRAAAAQNFAAAQNNLGILLAEGRGSEANPVEAYTWLALAVENGAAPVGRDLVRQQLSPAQLDEANAALIALRAHLGVREPSSSDSDPARTGAAMSAAGVASTPVMRAAGSPPPGSLSVEIIELNERVVTAESEVGRIRTENTRQAELAEALRIEKVGLEQQLAIAASGATQSRADEAERTQFQAELAEARLTTLRLAAENERLKSALAVGETRPAGAAKGDAPLAAEKSDLQKQIVRLQGQFAERETQVTQLEAANRALTIRLTEMDPRSSKAEREAFERLHEQYEAATRKIADLNARSDSLEQDLIVARQSAAAALAAQATAVRAGSNDALQLEMQTLQLQVRGLESQLDEDRKNSAHELAIVATQLQNARETNRSLTDANRSLLQAKSLEDNSVKAELAELLAKLKSAQTDLQLTLAEQTRLIADLESRTRDLDLARASVRSAEQGREVVRGQLEETGQRLDLAERRLAQANHSAETARAEAEKATLNMAALQTRHAAADRTAGEHAAEIARLAAENRKFASERTGLEQQLVELRVTTDSARKESVELKSRVSAGDRVLQEQLAVVNELIAANEKLGGQVRDLTSQLTMVRAENARVTTHGDPSQLRTELNEARTRLAEVEKSARQQSETAAQITGANEKLSAEVRAMQGHLAELRADNARLAQADAARQDAEQRAASLSLAATQLTTTQRELAASRDEVVRLTTTVQAIDRDRGARIAQLQQENAAITARLRQAQGTLEQIASTARMMNPGSGAAGSTAPVPTLAPPTAPGMAAASAPTPATPASTPVPARTHIVAEGDSLTRISVRYYGTISRWQEIFEANRETLRGENTLRPGQRLRIP